MGTQYRNHPFIFVAGMFCDWDVHQFANGPIDMSSIRLSVGISPMSFYSHWGRIGTSIILNTWRSKIRAGRPIHKSKWAWVHGEKKRLFSKPYHDWRMWFWTSHFDDWFVQLALLWRISCKIGSNNLVCEQLFFTECCSYIHIKVFCLVNLGSVCALFLGGKECRK